jgi:ribosomal protein S8
MKKIAFHNLGCKVNTYELDAMMQMLIDEGYQQVPFEDTADIYIINTCTVTNIADRKSRQMIHKARKNNPDAVIVAVGCYVQTRAGGEGLEDIDLCIGNNHKGEIAKILKEEGFINDYKVKGATKKELTITLKYAADGTRVISGLKKISKPGLRVNVGCEKLPKVLKGLGIAIISTSQGVMTDSKARTLGIGGEVIAYVW